MRLVTLNLRHGGGRRMPALLGALLGYLPDVLVLTEHRHNAASTLLREELKAAGLRHQIVSPDGPRMNHRDFRRDHVFLSPACAPRLRRAWFDHAVRETGATDHSALIVDLQGSVK